MNILIAGAGPTGLTAALELARLGVGVRIIEKRPDPSPFSRAVGISRQSMDLLAPSGVAQALLAEAVVFGAIRIHIGARRVARLPLNFDERSRIWGLPQDRTEHHLAAALSEHGVTVEYGTELLEFSQDEQGITARTSNGDMTADLLIGADGIGSRVRQELGMKYLGHDLPETWSIADVDSADWPEPTAFQGFLLPGGNVCVTVPLGPRRFRVIASQPDALAALPVPMSVDHMHRAGTFRISVRQAERFQLGRAFLAGDAAHCHSPVGGRGMNLGIADAAALARCIADGQTDRYGPERHAAAARVIDLTERARKLLQGGGAARALIASALRLADAVPPLGRAVARRFIGA